MLVMRMMVVLVVLMVLEELVVLVGGTFKNSISPIKKKKSKINIYFRVVHSSIPLFDFVH